MKVLETPKIWRPFAYILMILLAVCVICLIFVPWQQSVIGFGELTVFSPDQRPQALNAQIKARINRWHVLEGDEVKKGDVIVELDEVDAKFLDNKQLDHLKEQRVALNKKMAALQGLISVNEQQIGSYQQVRSAAVPAAGYKYQQAQNKVAMAQQKLEAAKQNFLTADLNRNRRQSLYEQGLRSKRDLELAEQTYVKEQAEQNAAQAALEAAQNELSVADLDRSKVSAETLAKLQSSQAKFNEAIDKLATVQKDVADLDIKIANLERRILQRTVRSPINGRVVRLSVLGYGETLKEGDEIAVIVPNTTDQAVALFVDDFNAALVTPGRRVRLQFSGWPAVQFVGWPSIAVGTFAGKVAVIDAVDDGKNQFRMLIKPDYEAIKAGNEEPWPPSRFLRPGAQATGWILLDKVPLGFELWRQFNGFPPSLQQPLVISKNKQPKLNKAELKSAK